MSTRDEDETALDDQLDEGWDHLEDGELAEARAVGERLRREVAEAPEPVMLLAACARAEGNDERALELLGEAAALDPEWAEPDLRAAEILGEDPERQEEALRRVTRALDLADEEGEFLDAIAVKAALEIDLGRDEAARETLEQLPSEEASGVPPDLERELAHLHLAVDQPAIARRRLERLVRNDPEDADSWHALGLVAEAEGKEDEKRTAWLTTLDLDARDDADTAERLSEAQVAEVAEEALGELPARARQLLANVPILIADRPSRKDVEEGLDPRLLGLFAGSAYPETSSLGAAPQLTQILLFRYNLERVAADEDELGDEIRTTLLHETGHFFGMDEDDLDDVGLG
jgi:predicted Zn-dependent protease with MMP-like domain